MRKAHDPLGRLRIAVPCQAGWEGMAGDERVRHCSLCSLNVYNFAEMTRDEARALLLRTEGRLCARLYRRADGTVITRDCPAGIRAIGRRASRAAAALLAALCTLPAFAFGGKPRLKTEGSRVKLEIERVAASKAAVFTGVVREGGVPIPGVDVVIRGETATRAFTAVTDNQGAFTITSLDDGFYRVEVTLSGFKQAKIEHLQLRAGEVTHASVALRMDVTESITVGAITSPLMMDDGTGVRVSQDFLNKLPF